MATKNFGQKEHPKHQFYARTQKIVSDEGNNTKITIYTYWKNLFAALFLHFELQPQKVALIGYDHTIESAWYVSHNTDLLTKEKLE